MSHFVYHCPGAVISILNSRRHLYVVGLSSINAHRIWGGSLNRKLLLKVPDPLFSRPNIKEKIAVWLRETITDMFYQCLVAIEEVCKSFLGGDVSQLTDIRTKIIDKALSDVDVRFYWDLAVGLTAVDISEELLKMVVDLFTIVRSHAFTKGYMEMYKRSNKKGTQKAKALRKKLF